MTPTERKTIRTLLQLVRAVQYALDDGEMISDDGDIAIRAEDVGAIVASLDVLRAMVDGPPDMTPAVKAEYLLREVMSDD